ncbi:hypothetical protein K5X82_18390 [Halosquirtibacter xylanolyticus]|uniref:hypothetical protein n=1 Tax=Halosquirtibacter xylanolyticus TaxID=3374599 RepID=UPI00374793C3|nr:hypothetical protein K5X82_18390 [Prolixibacteraceae bacterium]
MAEKKKIINNTEQELEVTLVVREGEKPEKTAGTVNATIPSDLKGHGANQKWVEYGNDTNIYLNGIDVKLSIGEVDLTTKKKVLGCGKPLDNELNANDTIEISFDHTTNSIVVSTCNSDEEIHILKEGKIEDEDNDSEK